jgi:hypothetical protein
MPAVVPGGGSGPEGGKGGSPSLIDEIVCEGARRMLAGALRAEVDALYLHGLSGGDFVPALGQFLGSSASLPAAVITRLTGTWKAAQRSTATPQAIAVHLRTTSPIESTFATVRHRAKVTKGPGSRAAGLVMAFTLIESAQDRWRSVNAPHLAALVRAGAVFRGGVLAERPEPAAA